MIIIASWVKALSVLFLMANALAFSLEKPSKEDADKFFAEQKWAEAVTAYQSLIDQGDNKPAIYFNLARALHNLDRYEAARGAYIEAINSGYAREAQARYHLARAFMSLGDTNAALEQLKLLKELGAPNGRIIQQTAEFSALFGNEVFEDIVLSLTPCTAPEYRQFDFWIGEWRVSAAGNGASIGTNTISSVQDGCVVLESYTAGSFAGMSLNFYDSVTGKWHQTWMSNNGGAVYLEGGLTPDGAMQLSDKDLPISEVASTINKVTWTPNNDETVRQHWQQSADGGGTWNTVFDGIYTRVSE
jgi:tetratricopeptide (TPR) repeat protein